MADETREQTILAYIADPATHGGAETEVISTHANHVILVADLAYKMKRSVAYSFMDFSTFERRRSAALAEIRLNRRTAPDLYLGLVPVLPRPSAGFVLGPLSQNADDPRALEWLVVMRRFDGELLFDRMAQRGDLDATLMEATAERIAAFHEKAAIVEGRGRAAVRAVAEELIEGLARKTGPDRSDQVQQLGDRLRGSVAVLGRRLDRRARQGRVRHCHGDLHLRNICLFNGVPTLFDCIEFDGRYAEIDVLYDLAFLLMDLDHRRRRDLANRVLNRYLEIVRDYDGLAVLPLFLALRATVRARVEAGAVADGKNRGKPDPRGVEDGDYLEEAVAFLEPPSPALIAIGGVSGTGKTTLARAIAPSLGPAPGAAVIRSDVVRKTILGVVPSEPLGEGAYAPAVTRRVYGEIGRRAAAVLAGSHAVILDAVALKPGERASFRRLAEVWGVPFAGLWLEAPPDRLLTRVERRVGDASDATAEIVLGQLGRNVGSIDWLRIDAGGSAEATAAAAATALVRTGILCAPVGHAVRDPDTVTPRGRRGASSRSRAR